MQEAQDLRSFIDKLVNSEDIRIVKENTSPKYEIAALTKRMDGSKALLFQNIKGSGMRVTTNLIGTRKRFALACGAKRQDKINQTIIDSIKKAAPPRQVHSAKFFQNKSKKLSLLPIVTHFEQEPGAFITSSIVYVKNKEYQNQNSSFHRLLLLDDRHMSIRMVEGRHLHRSFVKAKEQGEDLRVSVVVGVHPCIAIAGAYQAQWGEDELNVANALLNRKLTLCKMPFSNTYVPSSAEIVLEGKILADRQHTEWMVEMLGTYDFKRKQPVFELDQLYYRNNPIYTDILSGFSEHRLLMGMPIEAKLNRHVKKKLPATVKVVLTEGGCNWLHAVVQIRKRKQSDGKKAIEAAFSTHRSLKSVTVVDDDIDPNEPASVEYAMATRFQADKNIVLKSRERGSSLDPSSDQKNLLTSKVGFDATKPLSKNSFGFEIAKIPREERIAKKFNFA